MNRFTADIKDTDTTRADLLFPSSMILRLRRAFTPKGMQFFDFYTMLKQIELGAPVPEDLKEQYRQAANRLVQITSPIDNKSLSPAVVNAIADSRTTLNPYFARLEAGHVEDATVWARLNNILVPLIIQIAADKAVYVKALQTGARRWGVFRKLNPNQERLEKLKDDNPEDYALMTKYKKTIVEIETGIQEKIQNAGLTLRKGYVMGRPVYYGVDPTTQEEMVYDTDGSVLSHDDYVQKRIEKFKADKKLTAHP